MSPRNRSQKTTQEIRDSLNMISQKLDALAAKQEQLAILAPKAKGTRDLAKQAAAAVAAVENPATQVVLKDIQEHPGTARKEIAERTKLPPTEVTKIVMDLQEKAKLIRLGSRRTTRWFSPESLGQAKR